MEHEHARPPRRTDGERPAQFTRRLEAFSDIVFGLSLSQLAFQLGVPNRLAELVNQPLRFVTFFASFAVICMFWLAHHRMFRNFVPGRIDVFLNFVYQAFTALVPFGMQVIISKCGPTPRVLRGDRGPRPDVARS
jgi:uncharacterized membrane protein